MKTALIVMTLMGCDCDAKICEFIKTADAGWTSIERCRADQESQIRQNTKGDYPLITASCTVKAHAGPLVASHSFIVPQPAGDRPIETIALGTPVITPVMVAKKTPSGYRMITVPLTHAYDSTAKAATRAAGWVRRYAMLTN
ncbi:hypothetical protein [Phyllobacterium endophyticum]|uniref:Uncharacterized protein n=1 Tax=Phyllobacterium endophyticum TaxID=1149773 RepID=A0A2P7AZ09_9HYPH|nr:hypothetical protein [Phyllobacterium endophyticum]MBB3235966.1 hypothetical protein [Phyllobacterium endophyticum]PSH59455.1 hypothetical protein CU100_01300 [Phyllobacterium endophyticum]TYR41592.1 hypothetical protein FY050_09945 [Phyllobacterium endophyticum]